MLDKEKLAQKNLTHFPENQQFFGEGLTLCVLDPLPEGIVVERLVYTFSDVVGPIVKMWKVCELYKSGAKIYFRLPGMSNFNWYASWQSMAVPQPMDRDVLDQMEGTDFFGFKRKLRIRGEKNLPVGKVVERIVRQTDPININGPGYLEIRWIFVDKEGKVWKRSDEDKDFTWFEPKPTDEDAIHPCQHKTLEELLKS